MPLEAIERDDDTVNFAKGIEEIAVRGRIVERNFLTERSIFQNCFEDLEVDLDSLPLLGLCSKVADDPLRNCMAMEHKVVAAQ